MPVEEDGATNEVGPEEEEGGEVSFWTGGPFTQEGKVKGRDEGKDGI